MTGKLEHQLSPAGESLYHELQLWSTRRAIPLCTSGFFFPELCWDVQGDGSKHTGNEHCDLMELHISCVAMEAPCRHLFLLRVLETGTALFC